MRTLRRHWPLAAALALTVAALAACGPGGDRDARGGATQSGVVNLYTSRHYDADLELYKAFTEATGVRVNRIELKSDELIERIKAEGPGSPADVILMADAGALWRAQQAGLLQPVRSETLESRIPAALRDPEGRWFGFSRRARVIAYDRAKVRPEEVATYEALASPRFKGKVCVRTSDNVYNLSIMAALIERWGPQKAETWARGVAANMARPPQGGDTDQIKAVAAGVCEVALSNSYYYFRFVRSEDAGDRRMAETVALSYPSLDGRGTHVNVSGAGVAANAPNRDAAVRFLEFLTTPEAQAIFSQGNNEYPAVPGAPVPEALRADADFQADPLPVSSYGPRQAEAQQIFDRAGWR